MCSEWMYTENSSRSVIDSGIQKYLKKRCSDRFKIRSWYNDVTFTRDGVLRSNDRNRRIHPLQEMTGRMGYISKESYTEIKNQLKSGIKIKTVIQSLQTRSLTVYIRSGRTFANVTTINTHNKTWLYWKFLLVVHQPTLYTVTPLM
jgi:hypothetical protein